MKLTITAIACLVSSLIMAQNSLKNGCGLIAPNQMLEVATNISKLIGYDKFDGIDSSDRFFYRYQFSKNDEHVLIVFHDAKFSRKGIVIDRVIAKYNEALKIYTEYFGRTLPVDYAKESIDSWKPDCKGVIVVTLKPFDIPRYWMIGL